MIHLGGDVLLLLEDLVICLIHKLSTSKPVFKSQPAEPFVSGPSRTTSCVWATWPGMTAGPCTRRGPMLRGRCGTAWPSAPRSRVFCSLHFPVRTGFYPQKTASCPPPKKSFVGSLFSRFALGNLFALGFLAIHTADGRNPFRTTLKP